MSRKLTLEDLLFSTGTTHEFQLVATVAADIKADLERQLKECSKKLTEFSKMEKQACQFAESVVEYCESMVDRVTLSAEKQVT